MNELHKRINKVINTFAFSACLERNNVELFDFQCDWRKYGSFEKLPKAYQDAIVEGEKELAATGEVVLA